MYRLSVVALMGVVLAGCVSNPIPEDYAGPTAIIRDSALPESTQKADFFYLSQVDERRIEDSPGRTYQTNYGRGFYMEPVVIERAVPARAQDLTIEGTTVYAAPILALMGTVYHVEGKVRFKPEPGRRYLVKGVLGEQYSAVWIEDEASHEPVTEKIEKKEP